MPTFSGRPALGRRLLLILLITPLVGCGAEPEIRSYTIPKEEASPPPTAREADALPSRMIAAIVLRDSEAWFFKLSGAEQSVNEAAVGVRDFLSSLELPEDDPNGVKWEIPDGWAEGPARQMRKATLVLPSEDKPLEVAISTLGYDGKAEPYLLANINRWRGQLGLPNVEKLDEAAGVETLQLEGGEAWLFDAVGKMASGGMGMSPPFARHPPVAPVRPPAPPAQMQEPEIAFDLPEGWTEQPTRPMVRQVLAAGNEDDLVDIAISGYSTSAPMISDPLENLNRWRRERELDEIDQSELEEHFQDVKIGDDEGKLAVVTSEDGSKATLAAMVEKFNLVWFFKMTGTKAGVDAHREDYISWLETVQIKLPTTAPDREEDE